MRSGVLILALLFVGAADPSDKINYSRDIRPILSNHCFQCHGPGGKPKGGLRLDLRDEALKELKSGARALVPGNLAKSELVARIASADPDAKMPPPETRKQLKDAEKELLRRWIAEGAEYGSHWAFTPPQRAEPPAVKNAAWASPLRAIAMDLFGPAENVMSKSIFTILKAQSKPSSTSSAFGELILRATRPRPYFILNRPSSSLPMSCSIRLASADFAD